MLLKIPDALTLETEADVRQLRDLLDCYLRLFAPTTPAETLSVPAAPITPTLPETPAAPSNNPVGKKTAEPLYLAALEALGGSGTGEEIYQKFLELGFSTGAKNPRNAIKTYMRQRSKFAPLPPDEHGVIRWGLKPEDR